MKTLINKSLELE